MSWMLNAICGFLMLLLSRVTEKPWDILEVIAQGRAAQVERISFHRMVMGKNNVTSVSTFSSFGFFTEPVLYGPWRVFRSLYWASSVWTVKESFLQRDACMSLIPCTLTCSLHRRSPSSCVSLTPLSLDLDLLSPFLEKHDSTFSLATAVFPISLHWKKFETVSWLRVYVSPISPQLTPVSFHLHYITEQALTGSIVLSPHLSWFLSRFWCGWPLLLPEPYSSTDYCVKHLSRLFLLYWPFICGSSSPRSYPWSFHLSIFEAGKILKLFQSFRRYRTILFLKTILYWFNFFNWFRTVEILNGF